MLPDPLIIMQTWIKDFKHSDLKWPRLTEATPAAGGELTGSGGVIERRQLPLEVTTRPFAIRRSLQCSRQSTEDYTDYTKNDESTKMWSSRQKVD